MRTTRRGFFGLLATALVAPTLRVRPRAASNFWKFRVTDSGRFSFGFTGFKSLAEMDRITRQVMLPAVQATYFRVNPLIEYLKERDHAHPQRRTGDARVQAG